MCLTYITNLLLIIFSALLAIAFYTLRERKFLGYIQYRKGPNKPTLIALTIPIADAIKLFTKKETPSTLSNSKFFIISPMLIIILTLTLWTIYPHYNLLFFIKFNILFFITITRVIIYATFIAGWSSNSKWGILGALRGIAQTISYEVRISLILILFIIHPASINLSSILLTQYSWLIYILLPLIITWIISILAETHRTPFDFAEGESELVSGFNIEYRRAPFALIFIAEYINILLIRIFSTSLITTNYSNLDLILKTTILSFIFIWARGALPRLRYDILIHVLWKKILPIILLWLLLIIPLIIIIK